VVWAPVNGNDVVLWLNVDVVHDDVLWHCVQSVGKPLVTWFGFVVPVKSYWWQP
jgi:hypothetical protein